MKIPTVFEIAVDIEVDADVGGHVMKLLLSTVDKCLTRNIEIFIQNWSKVECKCVDNIIVGPTPRVGRSRKRNHFLNSEKRGKLNFDFNGNTC